jgi:FAD:protein FMN transferase
MLLTHRFNALGGPIEFSAVVTPISSDSQLRASFAQGESLVQQIEDQLSEFKTSFITELNASAGKLFYSLPKDVYALIKLALDYSKKTQGYFDITFASLHQYYRQCEAAEKIYDQKEEQELTKWIDYRLVKLDDQRGAIYLPDSRMKVSLGGIGKGYAVDQVYQLFRKNLLEHFLVNGNGDMRVHSGSAAQRSWNIGIKNPFAHQDKFIGNLPLKVGAVATSGNYIRKIKVNKTKTEDHIFILKQQPLEDQLRGVTVISSSAVDADVMATALMGMGKERATLFARQQQMKCLLFAESGDVVRMA